LGVGASRFRQALRTTASPHALSTFAALAALTILARDGGLGETAVAVSAELRYVGARVAAASYAATLAPQAASSDSATAAGGNATDVVAPAGPSEMLRAHWGLLGQLLGGASW
jgi:hypothetical protein